MNFATSCIELAGGRHDCFVNRHLVSFRHSTTLWADAVDEDNIAQIVTTWIITLEKQGCNRMIAAGIEYCFDLVFEC